MKKIKINPWLETGLRFLFLFLFLCLCSVFLPLPMVTGNSEVTVGGATGAGHIIQDEGTTLRQRPYLNFVGSSATCEDSGGKTVCTFTGGAGGGGSAEVAIEKDNLEVLSTSSPRIDFLRYFDVTESPTDEANITLNFLNTSTNSATATSGNLLVADGSAFNSVALSGDGSLTSTGALTVADDSHAHIFSDIDATTSANWAGRVSDETGTGAWVFANTPTLVTPVLGTPTSGTLTNATGLPVSTGISGLGSNVATFLGTPSSANLASAITNETGSGALVFATSPTLVTPALGTPASGVATNLTALNATQLTTGTVPVARVGAAHIDAITEIAVALKDGTAACGSGLLCLGGHTHAISTEVSGLGSNVATFLATPSTANFASAVTGETGTGAVVFGTSPTFTTSIVMGAADLNEAELEILDGLTATTAELESLTDGSEVSIHSHAGGGSSLTGLTDVNSATATAGYLLVADGSNYQSVTMSGDCTITGNGAMSCTGGSGATELIDLVDVNSATAAYGNFLMGDGGADFISMALDFSKVQSGTNTTATHTIGAGADVIYNDGDSVTGHLHFGTDQDVQFVWDESADTMIFSTTDGESFGTDYGIFTFAVDSDNNELTTNQEIFEVGHNGKRQANLVYTELFSIDQEGDVHIVGDATIDGSIVGGLTVLDDVNSATATSGYMLVADGSNYQAVAMSGDVTINANGATVVADDSHAHIFSDIDATTSANWRGRVSDETGTGLWVFGTSPTITTPNFSGQLTWNAGTVDDDDCSGDQGLAWYDTTDSQFEFCNSGSGAPTTLGGGSVSSLTDLNDVSSATVTRGRILVADGSNFHSLAIGSNDQVLTADSAVSLGVKWAAAAGGANALTDLNDVNSATSTYSNLLIGTGGDGFVSRLGTLTDLSDVNSATTTDGFLMVADGTNYRSYHTVKAPAAGGIVVTGDGSASTFETGLRPDLVTGDPCGDTTAFPTGSIFYNSSSNYHCFCNGAGADIKMNDNTTACF